MGCPGMEALISMVYPLSRWENMKKAECVNFEYCGEMLWCRKERMEW